MPSSIRSDILKHASLDNNQDRYEAHVEVVLDDDVEFGGTEARKGIERKLLWKLDLRMSILIVIYILNFIDRNNVSAARLRGFEEDLHLTDQQFDTILSILYVGYIMMQVPSNIFLNFIGKPSLYLPCCMILWGIISCLTGVTTRFVGVLLTRFFLGFCECAFFPGAVFLLSKWYTKKELGFRMSLLSCGSLMSNAFGSLIASGVLDGMQGKLGYAAWRWLFFIEGSLTCFVAVIAIFVLPDFPSNSETWLSPAEKKLAEKRMAEDAGVGDEKETETTRIFPMLQSALTDWQIWFMTLAVACLIISISFNAFFPTLCATMGYNRTVTLLLCAPPWVFATLVAFGVTKHSDAVGERSLHMIFPLIFGLLGFVIASATMNTAARYISLFLMAQSYTAFIVFLTWISSTFPRPASKRSVAIAFINGFGQLGNVTGSYIWPANWGPSYRYSYAICIASNCVGIIMIFIFRAHLASLNEKLAQHEREQGKPKGYRYLL